MTTNTKLTIAQRIYEMEDYWKAMDEATKISVSNEEDFETGTSEFTFKDDSMIMLCESGKEIIR